jgi:penicillin V acylase-like amidase (Ntn superfamily)
MSYYAYVFAELQTFEDVNLENYMVIDNGKIGVVTNSMVFHQQMTIHLH